LDPWCGEPLIHTLSIPAHLHTSLKANVKCFIENSQWKIPSCLLLAYPNLKSLVEQVAIPLVDKEDKLLWTHSHDGELSLKDSFSFHCTAGQNIGWTNFVWNLSIPPSKSFVIWRCLHSKIPTDDNLSLRGCNLPSMCSLCEKHVESSKHLFLECCFAKNIWSWLAAVLNVNFAFLDFSDIFKFCSASWSPLCKLVISAAIVNCVYFIWYARNQRRFADKKVHYSTAINQVIAAVSLSGNHSSLRAYSKISEFVLLKAFHVNMKYVNAPKIIEVIWTPPIFNWVKCNCDGASIGNPGPSSCGGIFRNSDALFLGAYAFNLGTSSSLNAELVGAMYAIETAVQKGWFNLWLETDSMLVLKAFSSVKVVPWHLRNRWDNCLLLSSRMNFFVTHIYREGNHCADKLANLGLSLQGYTWWSCIPPQLAVDYDRNRLGFPSFRFC
jgi:ribonuclease HI